MIVRALEDIDRDLSLLAEQGRLEGFFKSAVNADKLGGLIEDIRDTMMEYQVCISKKLFVFIVMEVNTRARSL